MKICLVGYISIQEVCMDEQWLEKLRTLLKATGLKNIDAFLGCADIPAYEEVGKSIQLEMEDAWKYRQLQ